jgi:hypothetical protein
MFYVVVAVQI